MVILFTIYSTGHLGYSSKTRIYEEIPDVLAKIRGTLPDGTNDFRASGAYDEIPILPKPRTDSAGSADSSCSSGKGTPLEPVFSDSEKDKKPKKGAKDLLRVRSFTKPKTHSSPKKTLDSHTTSDVLVNPSVPKDPREAIDMHLSYTESKGSLLQIMRNLASRNRNLRKREEEKSKRELVFIDFVLLG